MKSLLSFILVFAFVITLCGCGNKNNSFQPDTSESSNEPSLSPEPTQMNENISSSTEISDENIGYNINPNNLIIKGVSDESTLSGLSPLLSVSYEVKGKSSLPDKKLSHSHGPASGGEPHHTVIEFQKTFDNYSAYTLDTETEEKVLYLTFDCGYEYDNLTSDILDTLKEKQVSAAFFCTLDHITAEPELIARMIKEGHIVGNHSTTHPSFTEISREKMAEEIEETENYLREKFGYCAKFFRFPKGEYTETALDLVASLGYISVFWSVAYNDWDTNNIQGKEYAVDTVMSRLHDGAIILLHSVSRDNAEALGEIIDKAREEGYEFRSLDELVI